MFDFIEFVNDGDDQSSLLQGDDPDLDYPEGVTVENVDHYGGEGQGEEYWTVYKVTDANAGTVRHYRVNGFYASYDGSSYEDTEEVKQTEVMVTKWV